MLTTSFPAQNCEFWSDLKDFKLFKQYLRIFKVRYSPNIRIIAAKCVQIV